MEQVAIPWSDYTLYGLRGWEQLRDFANLLEEQGYIELFERGAAGFATRLTLEGWKRADELRRHGKKSAQAFVAMWFSGDLTEAWEAGFEPALKKAGWDPIRIDMMEHNDKIDDRIIAEIRRSGLLVADFTGQRGGVYFEAGFAFGLGIPVIWTVHEDDIDNVHFDTRQYNHIVWKDPEDLRTRLYNRLMATVAPPT